VRPGHPSPALDAVPAGIRRFIHAVDLNHDAREEGVGEQVVGANAKQAEMTRCSWRTVVVAIKVSVRALCPDIEAGTDLWNRRNRPIAGSRFGEAEAHARVQVLASLGRADALRLNPNASDAISSPSPATVNGAPPFAILAIDERGPPSSAVNKSASPQDFR
jgi:hypothetical protein